LLLTEEFKVTSDVTGIHQIVVLKSIIKELDEKISISERDRQEYYKKYKASKEKINNISH
jgi:hypothetical protein